jgi:hypothetical protein
MVVASGGGDRWRVTLWVMVLVQFMMSSSFSISVPFMALFLQQLGAGRSLHRLDLLDRLSYGGAGVAVLGRVLRPARP